MLLKWFRPKRDELHRIVDETASKQQKQWKMN